MIKKSLNFFENQINEKKQKNKVITDISIFTIKELFVHFLCALFVQFLCLRDSFQNFSQLKGFSPVEIKCLGRISTLLRKNSSIGKFHTFNFQLRR